MSFDWHLLQAIVSSGHMNQRDAVTNLIRPTLIALCALGIGSTGCQRSAPEDPTLLAKVGTREIHVADFQAWAQRQPARTSPPSKESLFEEYLDHVAIIEHCKAVGLEQSPEVRRAYESLLISHLRARELEPQWTNAMPTKAQIEEYYQTNQVAFTEPAKRRGALLFLEVAAKASDEKKKEIRQRIEQGRSKAMELLQQKPETRGFGSVAIEFSEDQPTRYRGGDIGWIEEGKLAFGTYERTAIESLFSLSKPGEVSPVLETPKGFYVTRLLETRPRQVKPLTAVEPIIQHKLLMSNRERLETQWKAAARGSVPRQISAEAKTRLPELPRPTTTPSDAPPSLPK
jgi:hypothetical protein